MGSVGYGLERTLVNTWLVRSQGSDDERATFLGNKSQNVFFFRQVIIAEGGMYCF